MVYCILKIFGKGEPAVKNRVHRLSAFVLLLLLLAGLTDGPGRASSASGVYFTAANEQLMPLSEDTMPFYSNGVLYVSSRLFEGEELGLSYSRHVALGLATLYKHGSTLDLRFDMAGQIAYDKEGNLYSGYAIERNGIVFFPLRLVCQYFDLTWSYCETDTAPLIRVKSADVILTDSDFIYAATTLMNDRYNEYERSLTSRPPSVTPSAPVDIPEPPVQAVEGQKVYLIFDGGDALDILSVLGDVQATFLLTAEQMADGDLVRALVAGGHAVALRIQSEDAEKELRQARAALWRAACVQLELVWSDGDLQEEGCVRVHADLNAPNEEAANLLRSIGRFREDVAVYLGGSSCLTALPDVLDGLREGGYHLSAWRLTA